MNTYGPSEFIQKLKANDLPDDDDVTIAGLVKDDAGADDVIGFSTSMSCESWLTIPTSMIADITHLRTSSAATTSTRSSRSDSSSPIPHRPNSFSYSACCPNCSAPLPASPDRRQAAGG